MGHLDAGMVKGILVSVCVQTFQHSKYIRECLDSILAQQTEFYFEIIIGEDESTDGTREICLEYARRFPDRIQLNLRARKDVIYIGGIATGRFNLIENLKRAKGKYIAILDGDDYWIDSEKLQKQVSFLESRSDVVMCGSNVLIQRGQIKEKLRDEIDRFVEISELLVRNPFPTATVLLRNNFGNGFPRVLFETPFGDWMLYWCLIKNCNYESKLFISEAITAVYRQHEDGIYSSLTKNEKIKKMLLFYKQLDSETNYLFSDKIKGATTNLKIKMILLIKKRILRRIKNLFRQWLLLK